MRALLIIGLVACIGFSCAMKSKQNTTFDKTLWLLGTWENKTSRGSIYEHWTAALPHSLSGKSYMIRGQDTTVFETITVKEDADGLWYIPTVTNQNNNRAVKFKAKVVEDSLMVFENLRHDFPQVISYRLVTPDSLLAEISGNKDGNQRSQRFPMRRID